MAGNYWSFFYFTSCLSVDLTVNTSYTACKLTLFKTTFEIPRWCFYTENIACLLKQLLIPLFFKKKVWVAPWSTEEAALMRPSKQVICCGNIWCWFSCLIFSHILFKIWAKNPSNMFDILQSRFPFLTPVTIQVQRPLFFKRGK